MRTIYNNLASRLEKRFRFDAHYFLSGGFWMFSSQATSIIFGIIATAIFANYLSEIDYGIYRYLLGIGVFLSSFSLIGIGQSILQAAAKKHLRFYKETLKLSIYYSLGITAVALATSIYYLINENYILATGCLFIAIFQPLINSFQFVPAYLQGNSEFKKSAFLQSGKVIFVSLLLITTLYFTSNVVLLFLTYLVSNTVFNVGSYLLNNKYESEPTPDNVKKELISYAKHSSVRNLFSNIAFRLDTILVFTQLGAAELAVYTIANIIPEQIKGTFKNMTTLLLPKYTQHENIDIIKNSLPKRSLQLFLILLAIAILYCIFAPLIYQVLFPKYMDAVIYSQIFALIFPSYIYYLPLTALMSRLDEKKLYNFHIISSIFQIVITILFIYMFSLLGAVLARMVTQYYRMIHCYYLVYKK